MAANQKPFYVALAVIVVGGGAFLYSRAGKARNFSIPANVVVTAADTSGFRGYFLGKPDAPVEITEYADFRCPHCADFEAVQFPDLKARAIDPGKARLRFRDFPLFGDASRITAHAAACADDQHKFWEMKASIFEHQTEWGNDQDPSKYMATLAQGVGLDVPAWTDCMKSAKYAARIQASSDEGNALGVHSTPSFLVNGRIYTTTSSDELVKLVDSLIAAAPPAAPKPAPPKPAGGL